MAQFNSVDIKCQYIFIFQEQERKDGVTVRGKKLARSAPNTAHKKCRKCDKVADVLLICPVWYLFKCYAFEYYVSGVRSGLVLLRALPTEGQQAARTAV